MFSLQEQQVLLTLLDNAIKKAAASTPLPKCQQPDGHWESLPEKAVASAKDFLQELRQKIERMN